MIRLYSLCLLFSAIFNISAQTPQYYKGLGTSNSTFLFGYTSYARHSQCIYTPYNLQFPPSGTISTVYYRYGSTGQLAGNKLYNFRVYFLQIADSSFQNTNQFFTGTTNALVTDSLVIPPGVTGEWFPIQLTTPFTYDPALTLVVELRYDSVILDIFGTYGTNNNGQKLISGDSTAVTGDLSSSTWQDFGFDQVPVGIINVNDVNFTFSAMPVPFSQSLFLSTSKNISEASLDIIDVTGKAVYHREKISGQHFYIDTGKILPGIYFIRIKNDKLIITKKTLKYE